MFTETLSNFFTEDFLFGMRIVNLILGLIAFSWLIMRISSMWPIIHTQARLGAFALLAYSFTALYSTGEILVQHAEGFGLRIPMAFIAQILLVASLYATRGDPAELPGGAHSK